MNEKHYPAGSPKGGQFAPKEESYTEKIRESIKKYSDTPTEDMAAMGVSEKPSIADFVTRVKSGRAKPNEVFDLGEITDRARNDIEMLTGQKLNAKKHVVDADAIRHIDNRHGENGKADSSMSDIHDYEEIADILKNYESLDFARKANGEITYSHKYKDSKNRPVPHIVYTMKNGKTMYLIEAVTDSKKGVLHIVSAYKN